MGDDPAWMHRTSQSPSPTISDTAPGWTSEVDFDSPLTWSEPPVEWHECSSRTTKLTWQDYMSGLTSGPWFHDGPNVAMRRCHSTRSCCYTSHGPPSDWQAPATVNARAKSEFPVAARRIQALEEDRTVSPEWTVTSASPETLFHDRCLDPPTKAGWSIPTQQEAISDTPESVTTALAIDTPEGTDSSATSTNTGSSCRACFAERATEKSGREAPLAVAAPSRKSRTAPRRPRRRLLNTVPGPRQRGRGETIYWCSEPHCVDNNGIRRHFRRKEHRRRHEQTVHRRDEVWSCWVCARTFSRKDNMTAHFARHGRKAPQQKIKYVATLDQNSDYFRPDWQGDLTDEGWPIDKSGWMTAYGSYKESQED